MGGGGNVKIITASSERLFSYWLKGLMQSVERETEGQISEAEVIHEVVRYSDYIHIQFNSIPDKETNYEAHFTSCSFPILMF